MFMDDTIYVARSLNPSVIFISAFSCQWSLSFYLHYDLVFFLDYKFNLLGNELEKKNCYSEESNLAQGIFRNES